jgi:hypothetical protein
LIGLLLGTSGCAGLMRRCCKGPLVGSCRTCPENCASCGDCYSDCGAGCYTDACGDPCCEDPGCRLAGRRNRGCVDCGPQSGTITYPYYTIRGPRDFLAASPRSIGPY